MGVARGCLSSLLSQPRSKAILMFPLTAQAIRFPRPPTLMIVVAALAISTITVVLTPTAKRLC